MGFKLGLSKDKNFMATDFPEAYWKIYNIGIGELNGDTVVQYVLRAFPSREASKAEGGVVGQLAFGGSMMHNYDASLYEFTETVPTSVLFGKTIPNDMAEIKRATYNYIKQSFHLVDAVDILEE